MLGGLWCLWLASGTGVLRPGADAELQNCKHVNYNFFRSFEGVTTFNSIMETDVDVRKDLYENIVLYGDTTMHPWIDARMKKKLRAFVPVAMQGTINALPERKFSIWIGGPTLSSLSTFAEKIPTERGYTFVTDTENEIVRDIKERLTYVALDSEAEMAKPNEDLEKTYELPDGNVITVRCIYLQNCKYVYYNFFENPEEYSHQGFSILANMSCGIYLQKCKYVNYNFCRSSGGVTTFNSIRETDVDVRKDLYENIVLYGGTTMHPWIDTRMKKELRALVPAAMQSMITAPPEWKFSIWIGGPTLSSLSTFAEKLPTERGYT